MNRYIALIPLLAFPAGAAAQSLTQAELRQYVERALKENTVPIEAPYFTAFRGRDGIQYAYSLGGVNHQSFSASYSGTGLLAIPLEEQFRASIIRKYRNTAVRQRFWLSRLERVEDEIAAMLEAIDSAHSKEDKWSQVLAHRDQVNAIFHQAMIDANIISPDTRGPNNPCYACSQVYAISITTKPDRGIVKYLPAGDWDLYVFRSQIKHESNVPKPDWITVEQGSVALGGKYWFSVSWNGVERYKRLIHITKEAPIVFRPER